MFFFRVEIAEGFGVELALLFKVEGSLNVDVEVKGFFNASVEVEGSLNTGVNSSGVFEVHVDVGFSQFVRFAPAGTSS